MFNINLRRYEFSFTDKFLRIGDDITETRYNHFENGKVLVLNQGYEPVSICSAKKAFLLLYMTRAELIANKDGIVIRSPRQAFPYPSVIRIPRFYRLPYQMIDLSRKNIMRRDSFKCQYCGSRTHNMTIDHVIPKSRGGNESWENLVAACIRCNNRKGNRTPDEANMKLLTKPKKPNHIFFLKQFMGTCDDHWRPFLFMD